MARLFPQLGMLNSIACLLSEILDAAEFGEAAINEEYDENATNPAQELGLKVCDIIDNIITV